MPAACDSLPAAALVDGQGAAVAVAVVVPDAELEGGVASRRSARIFSLERPWEDHHQQDKKNPVVVDVEVLAAVAPVC